MKTTQTYYYPLLILILFSVVRLCLSIASFTSLYQSPATVIHIQISIHTVSHFIPLCIFTVLITFLTQYIARNIMFGEGGKRSAHAFLLLIFTRYILPLILLQYLLLEKLPDTNYIKAISAIIYNVFTAMMLPDLIVYFSGLKPKQGISIRIVRWNFHPCANDLFKLQGFIIWGLTFMLLARYFMTCRLFIDPIPIYSVLKAIASVPALQM